MKYEIMNDETNLFELAERSKKRLKVSLSQVVGQISEKQASRRMNKINVFVLLRSCLDCFVTQLLAMTVWGAER